MLVIIFFMKFIMCFLLLESGAGGAGDHRELLKVRKQYLQLMEEHNLVKIKVELLLDMVSRTDQLLHLALHHFHKPI